MDAITQTETCAVSMATQTDIVYSKDAMTSTLTLYKSSHKQIGCQVKLRAPKKKSKNARVQVPTPNKRKNLGKWRSTFRASLSSFQEKPGRSNFSSTNSSESNDESSGEQEAIALDFDHGFKSVTEIACETVDSEMIDNYSANVVGCDFPESQVVDYVSPNLDTVNNSIVNSESVNSESDIAYTEFDENDGESSSEAVAEEVDEDYIPSEVDESTESSACEEQLSQKLKVRNERTMLVYESNLYELLRFCPQCGSRVDGSLIEEMKHTGSQLHLKITCFNNCHVEWKSQPTVGSLKGLGNLFLSSSIAFAGIPFAKFQRFAWLINLKVLSDSVYYQLRRDFIIPVVRRRWKHERRQMIKLLQNRNLVVLVGDGRCDSPGHSAKYCTYTFMETDTGKVIDTVVVPVTEVNNSNAMEKEGFIRLLSALQDKGVKIDIVSTDRHTQIRKLMRTNPQFNAIKHQFDPWHIAKGVCKKLNKAAKKKSRETLLEWVPSIVNHFWWSVNTCNKDPQLLYEKLSSVVFHTINKHKWGGYKKFKKCEHAPLTKEQEKQKKWLVEGSDAHNALVSVIKHTNLKNDCKYLTESIHTTDVEVFNNLLLKYIPKQYHFEYDHMVMGAYLAALDNNFNSERAQDIIQSGHDVGKYKYKIAWRKPTKKFIARKVFQKKRYDYFKIMMTSIHKRAVTGRKRKSRKRFMAPSDRESREEIIERGQKLSRYEN